MQHIIQIGIILSVSFAGELLNELVPLPVPGSIYGLVIMLVLLITKVVKLEKVKKVSDWLIGLMPIMFIGPTVSLMTSFDSYKNIIAQLFVISIVTTVITMGVTGMTAQGLINFQTKHRKTDTEGSTEDNQ